MGLQTKDDFSPLSHSNMSQQPECNPKMSLLERIGPDQRLDVTTQQSDLDLRTEAPETNRTLLERMTKMKYSPNSIQLFNNSTMDSLKNKKRSRESADYSKQTSLCPVASKKQRSNYTSERSDQRSPGHPMSEHQPSAPLTGQRGRQENTSKALLKKAPTKMTVNKIPTKNTAVRQKEADSRNQTCHGIDHPRTRDQLGHSPVAKRANYSRNITQTFHNQDSLSYLPKTPYPASPKVSGDVFLEGNLSTSTTSSPLSTALQLMKRQRLAMETQKEALTFLRENGTSRQLLIGPRLGASLLELPPSLSPIALRNFNLTGTTWMENSPRKRPLPTQKLSSTTLPSATWSEADRISSCQTHTNLSDCIQYRCREGHGQPMLVNPRLPFLSRRLGSSLQNVTRDKEVMYVRNELELPGWPTLALIISEREDRRTRLDITTAARSRELVSSHAMFLPCMIHTLDGRFKLSGT